MGEVQGHWFRSHHPIRLPWPRPEGRERTEIRIKGEAGTGLFEFEFECVQERVKVSKPILIFQVALSPRKTSVPPSITQGGKCHSRPSAASGTPVSGPGAAPGDSTFPLSVSRQVTASPAGPGPIPGGTPSPCCSPQDSASPHHVSLPGPSGATCPDGVPGTPPLESPLWTHSQPQLPSLSRQASDLRSPSHHN